jgi:cobalt-zinc-cadmium efflux system outer membrane protein
MAARRLFPVLGLLLVSGCLFHVREQADEAALEMATHAIDLAPSTTPAAPAQTKDALPPPRQVPGESGKPDEKGKPAEKSMLSLPDKDVQTTSWLQKKDGTGVKDILPPTLTIPERIPGAETTVLRLTGDKAKDAAEVRRRYPPLPALPDYPKGEPGPTGAPYTLADLHRIAVEHSPAIHEAVADVETARGNMLQAGTYPNPNVGLEYDPSNNGSTAAVYGLYFEQWIKTGGKLKLATAAAMKDLDNAELALKRARSDLATAVRNAYFNFLVARETVEVTQALAKFTDAIYRLQANLLLVGFAAPYEPAALRASAYQTRLAYSQAIETYIYTWKQLAAAVAVRDLPLSQVAGQVDRLIPRYDFNSALAHVLKHHTDLLIAQNGIEKQRYNLKAAQVVPVPDVDVRFTVQRELALAPFNWIHSLQFGIVLPIWDQNKGGVLAAEGTLSHALQEPKRVELTLTNGLAGAFAAYRTNLEALEAYRTQVLPDLVMFYRGVYDRRRIDPNAQFGDLVAAQAQLVTAVTTYLTTLGSLWSSVITLADFLQIDDLFQLGKTEPLPPLPTIQALPPRLPTSAGCTTGMNDSARGKWYSTMPLVSPTTADTTTARPAPFLPSAPVVVPATPTAPTPPVGTSPPKALIVEPAAPGATAVPQALPQLSGSPLPPIGAESGQTEQRMHRWNPPSEQPPLAGAN